MHGLIISFLFPFITMFMIKVFALRSVTYSPMINSWLWTKKCFLLGAMFLSKHASSRKKLLQFKQASRSFICQCYFIPNMSEIAENQPSYTRRTEQPRPKLFSPCLRSGPRIGENYRIYRELFLFSSQRHHFTPVIYDVSWHYLVTTKTTVLR